MRKTILLVALSLFSFSLAAQESEKLSFVEVVPVEGVSSDELYNRAEMWVATAFQNSNKVVKYRNKENKQLILNPNTDFSYSKLVGSEGARGVIEYTMTINIKDNRYRVEITDCFHRSYSQTFAGYGILTGDSIPSKWPTKKWSQSIWNELQLKMKQEISIVSISLKKAMTVSENSQAEDW